LELDLSDFDSITSFSQEVHQTYDKLDVLLNNAGIMTTPYHPTKNGLEAQIGVNHFGHYLLTGFLLDLLKKTPHSRIVNTASIAHRFGSLHPETFSYQEGKKYNKSRAYAQSKLANLLFTYQLGDLVKEHDLDIEVVASHPGISKTNLGRYIKGNIFTNFILWIAGIVRQNAYMGALPGVRAATDKVDNKDYFGPRGLFETKGYPKRVSSSKKSKDKVLQDLLWTQSIDLTGFQYDISKK
jgi:NAD(P)-dependent dehydrogenase (short-subunit alcohol dehydrogenase family)